MMQCPVGMTLHFPVQFYKSATTRSVRIRPLPKAAQIAAAPITYFAGGRRSPRNQAKKGQWRRSTAAGRVAMLGRFGRPPTEELGGGAIEADDALADG